jgi:hypothetical protein
MERYVIHEKYSVQYPINISPVYPVQKSSSACDQNPRVKTLRGLFLKLPPRQGQTLRNQSNANLRHYPNLLKIMCHLVFLVFLTMLVKIFSKMGKRSENLINVQWIFLPALRMLLLCHLL